MALNKEDKADVKGALGKAVANKIEKVTKDGSKGGIIKKFTHYRKTEDGHAPYAYGRSVKGGGMNIKQLVLGKKVYQASKNTSRSAGDVHGWKLERKDRSKTNL